MVSNISKISKCWGSWCSAHLWLLLVVLLFITRIHVDLPLFANTFPQPLALHCLTVSRFCRRWPSKNKTLILNQKLNENHEEHKSFFLPAAGRLSTNGATEFALKQSIPGNWSSAGAAAGQLPVRTRVRTRTHFNNSRTKIHFHAVLLTKNKKRLKF